MEAPPLLEVAIISKKNSQAENLWHMQYGRLSFKQTPDKNIAPSMLNFLSYIIRHIAGQIKIRRLWHLQGGCNHEKNAHSQAEIAICKI